MTKIKIQIDRNNIRLSIIDGIKKEISREEPPKRIKALLSRLGETTPEKPKKTEPSPEEGILNYIIDNDQYKKTVKNGSYIKLIVNDPDKKIDGYNWIFKNNTAKKEQITKKPGIVININELTKKPGSDNKISVTCIPIKIKYTKKYKIEEIETSKIPGMKKIEFQIEMLPEELPPADIIKPLKITTEFNPQTGQTGEIIAEFLDNEHLIFSYRWELIDENGNLEARYETKTNKLRNIRKRTGKYVITCYPIYKNNITFKDEEGYPISLSQKLNFKIIWPIKYKNREINIIITGHKKTDDSVREAIKRLTGSNELKDLFDTNPDLEEIIIKTEK